MEIKLENVNNSLKENNNLLKSEINKLKEELSTGIASYALESICSQVQLKAEIEEKDMVPFPTFSLLTFRRSLEIMKSLLEY